VQLGIVGLPNAGKSTLFNVVTGAGAPTGAYPFTTVDSNVGEVAVPDPRLERISRAIGSQSVVPASVRIVDIAGLVRGASRGQGLGNRFLGYIREVDAIAHVVRAFRRSDVSHSEGQLNPLRDVQLVEQELLMADAETLERRLESLERKAKSGDEQVMAELEEVRALKDTIDSGDYLAGNDIPPEHGRRARDLHLLSIRPVVYVINVDEETAAGPENEEVSELIGPVEGLAHRRGMKALRLCAGLEEELTALDEEEQEAFRVEMGLVGDGRQRFLHAAHDVLGLITYFTGNEKETRARSLRQGGTALEAARKVHSDIGEGFIRADVVSADDLMRVGSRERARRKGLLRSEGRDYTVCDGDVIEVHFRS